MSGENDGRWMSRAMELAMAGRGRVEPNPMVGCVIVKDGRLIGEGYHAFFGGPHAEPAAIGACSESPAGATAYVTLEPCCHSNKKTPPCVPLLIESGIVRVVYGCVDSSAEVNGRGLQLLREAGIEVNGPVMEAEARQLIAPFLARVLHHRPYVTLKWAQSADGQIAGRLGAPVHITNAASDRQVHLLRSRCDAIAVGTNTVISDDPLLTARGVDGGRRLLRVVLSNTLKIGAESRLVKSAHDSPLVVYSSESSVAANAEVAEMLGEAGAEVVSLPDHDRRFSFSDVLTDLWKRSVTHLLVEPGPTLARMMISERQFADRVWVFRSPREIGRTSSSSAPEVHYPPTGQVDLDGDVLTEYLNPASAVYFANAKSADLCLARASRAT